MIQSKIARTKVAKSVFFFALKSSHFYINIPVDVRSLVCIPLKDLFVFITGFIYLKKKFLFNIVIINLDLFSLPSFVTLLAMLLPLFNDKKKVAIFIHRSLI